MTPLQDLSLQERLTIKELLLLYGRLCGMNVADIIARYQFLKNFLQLPKEEKVLAHLRYLKKYMHANSMKKSAQTICFLVFLHMRKYIRSSLNYIQYLLVFINLCHSRYFSFYLFFSTIPFSHFYRKSCSKLLIIILYHSIVCFSGGQQRRASLAVALLHEPDLIILDEPVRVYSTIFC